MEKLRSTLIIFLMIRMSAVFAQTDTTGQVSKSDKHKASYEMGMNIMSLTMRAGDFYSAYNKQFDNQIFSGIYMKFFRGQNALRFGIDYSQRTIYYHQSGNLNRLKSFEIKAGYQRMLGKKKLAAYFFMDIEYNRLRTQGSSSGNYYLDDVYNNYYYNGSYDVSGNAFCASPGFGLRWKLYKSLVLNAESGAQFFYVHEKSKDYPYQKNTSVGTNIKLLKISIGFILK